MLLCNVSPALQDFAAGPVNPQDTCRQQGTTMCVMLLKRLIEYARGLCRLLWLFGREKIGSREASAAEQLLNMEHSHGPALIYNVNMLVENRLQWKRYIDWALDKSFNGWMLHCGRVDVILVKHRLMAHVCHLRCSWIGSSLFVFSLFLSLGWGPVERFFFSETHSNDQCECASASKSLDRVKHCCPINRLFFSHISYLHVHLALAKQAR